MGTYTPKIALDGVLSISHRADTYLKNKLNDQGAFSGDIINRDNIGKTSEHK